MNADLFKIPHHILSYATGAMTGKAILFRLRKFHQSLLAGGKMWRMAVFATGACHSMRLGDLARCGCLRRAGHYLLDRGRERLARKRVSGAGPTGDVVAIQT